MVNALNICALSRSYNVLISEWKIFVKKQKHLQGISGNLVACINHARYLLQNLFSRLESIIFSDQNKRVLNNLP